MSGNDIDSLFNSIKNLPDQPAKIWKLKKVIRLGANSNVDCKEMVQYGIEISKKLKNDSCLMESFYEMSRYAGGSDKYLDSAYAIAKSLNNKEYIAACLAGYGNIESARRNYLKAVDYHLQSLKYSEEIKNKNFSLYRCENLALIFQTLGESDKELRYAKMGFSLAEEIGDTEAITVLSNSLAKYYFNNNDPANALYYNNISLKFDANLTNQGYKILDLHLKGKIFRLKQNYVQAIAIFKDVITLAIQSRKIDYAALAYSEIAKTYIELKDYEQALLEMNKSAEMLLTQSKDSRQKGKNEILYKIYSGKKNFKIALKYHELWMAEKDSIFNIEKINRLNELETIYQTDKKDKEIAQLALNKLLKDQEIERGKIVTYSSVSILILVIIILCIGYWNIMVRKKNSIQLANFEKQQQILLERERIASELHDDLGSGLTKISLMSQMAGMIAGDKQQLTLKKITAESSEMVDKMNGIIWALNTKNDSLPNLISFIRKHAFELFENSATRLEWNAPDIIPEIPVSGEVRRNIYMAVNETLHNTLKYSNADNVAVNLFHEKEKLVIQVRDNGKGFNVSEMTGRGNGLTNIKKRMQEIGGETILESEVSKGTSVTFIYPIAGYTNV